MDFQTLFNIQGQTAVITGGSGVLGRAMAQALAQAGARVLILGRRLQRCEQVADEIRSRGGQATPVACDVLDAAGLKRAAAEIGAIDILINSAGGNRPETTTSAARSFFDLEPAALEQVFNLNFMGTFLACQAFGRSLAERGQGCIVNVTSMSALRPLTNVSAYCAAKAAVSNFTQWLAVHFAQEYSPNIRVNALAPGFFLTEQNRFLLIDSKTELWTERGQKIVAHTPMGRLGRPEDLIGTLLWLVSPASAFVTGTLIPVDGGFSAYSGV